MNKLLLYSLILLPVLIGCSEPEQVTIVHIGYSEEFGSPNDYTVVEFPDGTRSIRYNHYGKVGDTFTARKATDGSWY